MREVFYNQQTQPFISLLCAGLKTQIPMLSNSIGCKKKKKLNSPVYSSFVLVFASDMHLEPESEKRAKNVGLHTA